MDDERPAELPALDQAFLASMQEGLTELAIAYGTDASLDIAFVVFLRKMSRFGYFTYGPISIDVRLVEDILDRTAPRNDQLTPGNHVYSDSYVRFSRRLAEEVRRSGRRRIDELHFLLAFMRTDEGLPARVFGELGVTPEAVERYAQSHGEDEQAGLERLYSPEDAAEYLGVHVQTVRAWIRSGRLPASRLAGQRSLRIRARDLVSVLEPVNPGEPL